MKRSMAADQPGPADSETVEPATSDETRAALLERSNRSFAPIGKSFVQNPVRDANNRIAPLSLFVRNGDARGLNAFLFLHAFMSDGKHGWSTTLPLSVWARAFNTTETADLRSASNAATKIMTRLKQRQLIERERSGRKREITVTLLRPDGSGTNYTRPVGLGDDDRFLKLRHRYWTDGWHRKLDLPGIAMLLVALHEKPGFELATERVPEWYGWSADTALRGFQTLNDHGLIDIQKRTLKAPLAPAGITTRNVYTLTDVLKPPKRGTRPQAHAADAKTASATVEGSSS